MARLFGYFANQADRIGCALVAESAALALPRDTRIDGWGVGSYQGGEVLLRRRPTELREGVAFAELVRDLRTDCAIVHVRNATVGPRALENTHPFRFRQWLFAHTGSIPQFDVLRPVLLERLPDFLARTVLGETDSELFFSLFLAFVHNTGRLDDPELDRRTIGDALHEAVLFVDAASAKAGAPPATLNCIVTNHHAMVALRRGLPMSWFRRHGIRDCAACRKQPDVSGHAPKRFDHEAFKYVIVASDQAADHDGWAEAPDTKAGSLISIDRALDVQVTEL